MKMPLNLDAVTSNQHSTASANTDVVITLAATSGTVWFINWIDFSYSADPTGGELTVAYGGTTLFSTYITKGGASGPLRLNLSRPIPRVSGVEVPDAVVITLKAGGSGIIGRLNVQYQ